MSFTMSTADSWHTELREERREPKDLSKRPHQFFAGLHERAILPEATGRCKRLDWTMKNEDTQPTIHYTLIRMTHK